MQKETNSDKHLYYAVVRIDELIKRNKKKQGKLTLIVSE
jgi:hypothetical protein